MFKFYLVIAVIFLLMLGLTAWAQCPTPSCPINEDGVVAPGLTESELPTTTPPTTPAASPATKAPTKKDYVTRKETEDFIINYKKNWSDGKSQKWDNQYRQDCDPVTGWNRNVPNPVAASQQHPAVTSGHHDGAGHKAVYQEVAKWHPASESFVEARDSQLRQELGMTKEVKKKKFDLTVETDGKELPKINVVFPATVPTIPPLQSHKKEDTGWLFALMGGAAVITFLLALVWVAGQR